MQKLTIAAVAAFGGSFPNLMDLAVELTKKAPEIPNIPNFTYYIGILMFCAMSVGVALLWGETDLKRVFYIGFGLPSFIQVNVANFSGHDSQGQAALSDAIVGAAYAAESIRPIHGRTLGINRRLSQGQMNIIFSTPDNAKSIQYTIDSLERLDVTIPPEAEQVRIEMNGVLSNKLELPKTVGTGVTVDVERKDKTWSGLKRALGVKSVQDFKLEIQKESEKPK